MLCGVGAGLRVVTVNIYSERLPNLTDKRRRNIAPPSNLPITPRYSGLRIVHHLRVRKQHCNGAPFVLVGATKPWTPSEQVAIAEAMRKEMGNRQGQRTDILPQIFGEVGKTSRTARA